MFDPKFRVARGRVGVPPGRRLPGDRATAATHRGAVEHRVGPPPRSGGAALVLAQASARTSEQTGIEPERITDPVATVGDFAGHVGVVGVHDVLLIKYLNADIDHSACLR